MKLHSYACRASLAMAMLVTACGPIATAGPGCRPTLIGVPLPPALQESSGVAVSLTHSDVFWTHGDGRGQLFAVDSDGVEVGRFEIANRLRDWEDLALAQCPSGGSCLYLADLGDNYEEREAVQIIRVAEPDPTVPGRLVGDVFPVVFPDGPRDVEALAVLPGERVLFITKGRNHPVTVYRYPGPLRPEQVALEEVQRLTDGPPILPRQVTGASASPLGDLVAVRTYEALRFYEVRDDTLALMEDGIVNLRTLRESQGEGVGLGLDGLVALTSEGGPGGGPGSLALLRCRLGSDSRMR